MKAVYVDSIEEIKRNIISRTEVYIYGAKRVAQKVYMLLKNEYNIKGFVVSKKERKLVKIYGESVYEIQDVESNELATMIIAVGNSQYRAEIISQMCSWVFSKIIIIDVEKMNDLNLAFYHSPQIKIGKNVHIAENVDIWCDEDCHIDIGDNVTIAKDNTINVTNKSRVRIRRDSIIESGCRILANAESEIAIGEEVYISKNGKIYSENKSSIVFDEKIVVVDGFLITVNLQGKISVGSRTSFEGELFLTTNNSEIIIGRDCMFSRRVGIVTGGHGIRKIGDSDWDYGSRIVIEDHVWGGIGCNILGGVSIGEGSVIGASSVVTRDVPQHSIAVGNPARVIRNDIEWIR